MIEWIRKGNAPPQLPGNSQKILLRMVFVILVSLIFLATLTPTVPMTYKWLLGIPFLLVPILFFLIIRNTPSKCPQCSRPLDIRSQVNVVEDRSFLGRHAFSSWSILECAYCKSEWRIPKFGSARKGSSISKKEYRKLS